MFVRYNVKNNINSYDINYIPVLIINIDYCCDLYGYTTDNVGIRFCDQYVISYSKTIDYTDFRLKKRLKFRLDHTTGINCVSFEILTIDS